VWLDPWPLAPPATLRRPRGSPVARLAVGPALSWSSGSSPGGASAPALAAAPARGAPACDASRGELQKRPPPAACLPGPVQAERLAPPTMAPLSRGPPLSGPASRAPKGVLGDTPAVYPWAAPQGAAPGRRVGAPGASGPDGAPPLASRSWGAPTAHQLWRAPSAGPASPPHPAIPPLAPARRAGGAGEPLGQPSPRPRPGCRGRHTPPRAPRAPGRREATRSRAPQGRWAPHSPDEAEAQARSEGRPDCQSLRCWRCQAVLRRPALPAGERPPSRRTAPGVASAQVPADWRPAAGRERGRPAQRAGRFGCQVQETKAHRGGRRGTGRSGRPLLEKKWLREGKSRRTPRRRRLLPDVKGCAELRGRGRGFLPQKPGRQRVGSPSSADHALGGTAAAAADAAALSPAADMVAPGCAPRCAGVRPSGAPTSTTRWQGTPGPWPRPHMPQGTPGDPRCCCYSRQQ